MVKQAIKNISDENEKALWLHLKLDTGMGRLGMKDVEEYKEVIDIISKYDQLVFEGVYTHFACADEPGDSMATQYQKLKELVRTVEKRTYNTHSTNPQAEINGR